MNRRILDECTPLHTHAHTHTSYIGLNWVYYCWARGQKGSAKLFPARVTFCGNTFSLAIIVSDSAHIYFTFEWLSSERNVIISHHSSGQRSTQGLALCAPSFPSVRPLRVYAWVTNKFGHGCLQAFIIYTEGARQCDCRHKRLSKNFLWEKDFACN